LQDSGDRHDNYFINASKKAQEVRSSKIEVTIEATETLRVGSISKSRIDTEEKGNEDFKPLMITNLR
jgi:hypothetical protein